MEDELTQEALENQQPQTPPPNFGYYVFNGIILAVVALGFISAAYVIIDAISRVIF